MNHESVQAYYGEVLQTSADLQTNACCTPGDMPEYLKRILSQVHDEVLAKYYGCGLIAPDVLDGMHVLDLGCGAGRDVFALSAMVGPKGRVVGVDMTAAQLEVARAHEDFHANAFGYAAANTEFHQGLIENLDQLGLEPGRFDIVVSNCVLNLAMDKPAVLRGVYDLLKPGGEMYFSDVYADRRVPEALRQDAELYGECLSGALYWHDFENMARGAGFADPRLVEDRVLTVENKSLQEKLGPIGFHSATYRLFKLPELELGREDYGQAVRYKGGCGADVFALDKHHRLEQGKVVPVCGNTFRMLSSSRFAPYFDFFGGWDQHYGAFLGGGAEIPFTGAAPAEGGICC